MIEIAVPGISIATDLPPEDAMAIVESAAVQLGLEAKEGKEGEMRVRKGTLTDYVLYGFTTYCDYRVLIEAKNNRTQIDIERNHPWWIGLLGVGSVKSLAKKLPDRIEDDIEDSGGMVIESVNV